MNCLLEVHAVPNARATRVAGLHGGAVKIQIAAPPADGRANEVLLEFLAETLRLPRGAVTLAGGTSSRSKRVRIEGYDAPGARAALGLPA
jgi:uncharacterized protein (TIGR00251 family)